MAKKARLNKYKQKLETLEHRIDSGDYRLCFGTKHLLKRDIEQFRERRDSQISFVGCKSETAGNQTLQLSYEKRNNQFVVKLRKISNKTEYVYGKVFFNHHKKHIINILNNKTSPLTYKIIKRNGRYYLTCTFEILVEKEIMVRDTSNGTIGVDFNKGFISVAETNKYGHLMSLQHLPYRFGSGNKTTSDLQF